MEINEKEVKEKINNFRIDKESKEKMQFFYECIERSKKNHTNYNINIIIDNMPIKMIDKYLNYIKRVIKYTDIYPVFNKHNERYKEKKNGIILITMDGDIYWKMTDSEDYIKTVLSQYSINNNIVIITSINPLKEYDSFKNFDVFNTLPCISFSNTINEKNEYTNLIKKYKNNDITFNVNEEEFHEIINGIKDNTYIRNFNISDYLYDYSTKRYQNKKKIISMETFEPIINNKELKKDKQIDINKLIGLRNVKNELNSLFCYADFLKKHHINQDNTYLNMFFLGNPGTGKTMIANIVADNLYKMGYLEKNEVVKVIPTDLIGEYVGHTRGKVRKILKEAKGKILFIDEAYLLYSSSYKNGNNPFMQEAIIELLKYLEDPSNITIFAGYKDEMQKIYLVNPGIKSRIYKEIIFEDYTTDELYKILKNNLKEKGLIINKETTSEIKEYINLIKKEYSFGNAREMKQLSQRLIINHANNNSNDMIINRNDIPKYTKINNRMGFGE